MPRGRPPYPPEFRAEAVRLARQSDQSMRQIAQDLGIANESLRRWVIQADVDAGTAEGLTSDERAELTRLRREKDRKSTRLNSSHSQQSRMPSSA